MTLVDFRQARELQQEVARLWAALASAVAEQERLEARVAELAEMLAAVEAERDLAHRTLRVITAASGPPLSSREH